MDTRRTFLKHAWMASFAAVFLPGLNARSPKKDGNAKMDEHILGEMINVKAEPYHAAGNGDADDLPSIQAAISDCARTGGGTVFLPAGVYALKTGPLYLADSVSLVGSGMNVSILRLGNNVNQPVIMDQSVNKKNAHAFGRVHLTNFGIDGNQEGNPEGKEGVFSTAYFSIFENLAITNCKEHGLRLGSSTLENYASQNRVVGCRISKCGGAGIFIDINGIDSSISDNYVYECDYGITIRNGGIRIINNDIYNNKIAGVDVKQTTYDTIIANNDLNGNRRVAIHISRTTHPDSGPWSQLLIANNSILGNRVEVDNRYDAIHVETEVVGGIEKVTITGNKIFAVKSGKRFRHGVNLENNIHRSKCSANHIQDTASQDYNVGSSCTDIEIDSLGGRALGSPEIPLSGVRFKNPFHAPVTVYLSGGVVNDVVVGDVSTGLGRGSFRLFPGQFITIHYYIVPRWQWIAD